MDDAHEFAFRFWVFEAAILGAAALVFVSLRRKDFPAAAVFSGLALLYAVLRVVVWYVLRRH